MNLESLLWRLSPVYKRGDLISKYICTYIFILLNSNSYNSPGASIFEVSSIKDKIACNSIIYKGGSVHKLTVHTCEFYLTFKLVIFVVIPSSFKKVAFKNFFRSLIYTASLHGL